MIIKPGVSHTWVFGMAHFIADNGPDTGRKYELNNSRYILGRHPDCDIVVDVGAVSRQHAQVLNEGANLFVEDLKSRNGTFVNDHQLSARHQLLDGDKVRICDVVLTFHGDVPRAVPPTTPKSDESGFKAVLVDDETDSGSSTIMSKLDVISSRSGAQLTASPEAKLKAMLEITQNLGKTLSLDNVLPKVLDSLFKIFVQADRGFIGLVDETGKLVPRWSKLRRESDDTIRVSRTIVKQVIETKEAILSADAASDSRFDMSQSIADFRIRSMMCAPLIDSSGTVLGLIQVDTLDQRKRFQPEDLELLASTASQAAVAIDNAQLHDTALRQQAVERDLELAREVQRAFLPDATPDMPGYEFWAYYEPTNQVGGDYYDYIALPDGRTAAIVADVVGHGVAAAMLMAKLSAEVRYSLASEPQAAIAVKRLNDRMSRLQLDRFVTMIMTVFNPKTHEVIILNAGHMAPVHRKVDGSISEPGEDLSGIPLGIMEGTIYEPLTIKLEPGESLTMYTDGVNEALDRSGEQFSIQRLREHIARSDGTPSKIGEAVMADVRQFLDGKPQDDDICLVCIRRNV